MIKRRIALQECAAPVTQYIGFATITFGVALYEGATPLAAIPVVIVAAAVKTLWAQSHTRMFSEANHVAIIGKDRTNATNI